MMQMTQPAKPHALGKILAAPFVVLAQLATAYVKANQRLRAAERLGDMSDAQLAAHGKTRDSELRRIFGVQA